MLVGTEQELIELKTNGFEYNEFIADIIDDKVRIIFIKKHKKIKTISAQILDKFCLKYDGMGNFVISFCIQLLNFVCQGENITTIGEFSLLNQPYAERVLNSISQENKIETSLLVFTILTHIVTKSEKHLEGIRAFLRNYFNNILNYDSIFVKSRLCVFFGFYLDELFYDNKQLVDCSIKFLFVNLFRFNQFQGLSYQVHFILIIGC